MVKIDTKGKRVLDAACGGRMGWYDKTCDDALFLDIRTFEENMTNGQHFRVAPDHVMDFRALDIADESFSLVFFDPPHFFSMKPTGWLAKKYGVLDKETWKDDIRKGFDECLRVLKPDGVLVMKWSIEAGSKSRSITIPMLLEVIGQRPLFGTRPGSKNRTYWLVFMKPKGKIDP